MFEEISNHATELPYQLGMVYDCYYFGPNNYYYLVNGEFIDTLSDAVLDDAEYSALLEMEKRKDDVEADLVEALSPRSGATVYGTSTAWVTTQMTNANYFTSLLGVSFGNNTDGTCALVGSAILLGYYDNYVSDAYVPTQYENGYGTTEAFHQLLCDMLSESGSVPSIHSAKSVLNQGFSVLGLNATAYTVIGNHESVFNIVKSKIAANRPVIGGMYKSYNEDCPMNHAVVIYGYRELQLIETGEVLERYYYAHTGWYSPQLATYNYAWFADARYLNR